MKMKFYNELHLGDCLWAVTYFNLILGCNDFDVEFFVNPAYFAELEKLIHPAYVDRITFRPVDEADKREAVNTWIGAPINRFYDNLRENKQELQSMCFRLFSDISSMCGIVFPLSNKSEFIYDHPWLSGTNEMLRREGEPEILFVNSVPMSLQFAQQDSELAPLYEVLKDHKVFTTKKVPGFPCTQDYDLSLLQIGQVASRARVIIGIQTGPFCACVNALAVRNVKRWYVMAWKNKPEVLFHCVNDRFTICSSAADVAELFKKEVRRKPEVSVLMSLYRGENYLEEHLRQFQRYTFFNKVQLVICHNDPTEKEIRLIQDFDSRHPGVIKHVIKKELTNWAESMNECIRQSDADIVTIENVDDIRAPDALERQVEFLKHHLDFDVVHGNNLMSTRFGIMEGWRLENAPHVSPDEGLKTGMWLGPFFMWRKSVMEKVGYFDEQYSIAADFDLAMRLARRVKIGSVNEDLGVFLNAGQGLSTRKESLVVVESAAIKRRYNLVMQPNEQKEFDSGQTAAYNMTDCRWFGKNQPGFISQFIDHKECKSSVSVVIKSFNRLASLKLVLESFKYQSVMPLEVIVADDGSSDGTLEWLDSLEDKEFPFLLFYITRQHNGYRVSSLSREACRHVTGTRILFTDVDVIHCPRSVEVHAALASDVLGTGIIKSINEDGVSQINIGTIAQFSQHVPILAEKFSSWRTNLKFRQYNPNECPTAIWGGNFSVSTVMYRKIGEHDVSFDVGWGGEDSDVGKRFSKSGGNAVWLDESVGYHLDHKVFIYSYQQRGSKKFFQA